MTEIRKVNSSESYTTCPPAQLKAHFLGSQLEYCLMIVFFSNSIFLFKGLLKEHKWRTGLAPHPQLVSGDCFGPRSSMITPIGRSENAQRRVYDHHNIQISRFLAPKSSTS